MPVVATTIKTCIGCREAKSLSSFGKDKSRADGLNYYCKDCANARGRSWRKNNPDRTKEYRDDWRQGNSEHIRNYGKAYGQTEQGRAIKRKNTMKWRASKFNQESEGLPEGWWQAMLDFYGAKCAANPEHSDRLSFDHVVPLSLGGKDNLRNGQILCVRCNAAKGNRNSIDYRDHSRGVLVGLFGRELMILRTGSDYGCQKSVKFMR